MMSAGRIVLGVSGASGACLAIETLQMVKALGLESHLVVTPGAEATIRH